MREGALVKRLLGAFIRGLLVLAVVALPAFLLPNASQAAQEISLIIGGIAGAFTLFEYASSHPIEMIGEDSSETFRSLLGRAAAVSFVISFASFLFFALTLWLFKWPVGRDNFNLWINLPTFEPTSGRDVERRLFRDGTANLLFGIGLPFVIPVIASRSGGWFDPSVLQNYQPLIWGAALWAFLPASLIIRGAALIKVGWLVKRARG